MATVLTKALPGPQMGPQMPSPPVVLPDPHLEEIQAIQARMEALPAGMYTPEQIAQRRAENQRMYQLGVLGQLSGDENLSQVGAHVFKQALGQRQPHVTERGSLDPMTGQWAYNPEWQREQMQGRIDRLQQMRAAAQLQERAREDQQAHQRSLSQITAAGVTAGRESSLRKVDADIEDRMYDDFEKKSSKYSIILDQYKNLQAVASKADALSDIAMVFAYMKILDPTSVVKETEAASASNAAGVPDRVRNMYNSLLTGQRLNPQQRAEMVGVSARLAAEAQKGLDHITSQFHAKAKRRGLNPANITGLSGGDDNDPLGMGQRK